MSDDMDTESTSSSGSGSVDHGGNERNGAPPPKYHSERESTNESTTQQHHQQPSQTTNPSDTSITSSTPPPPSTPSPPPTSTCPHFSTLDLVSIRQRLRSRTFQKSFTSNQVECVDCQSITPLEHLWVCLHCREIDAARCGRFMQKHSAKHSRAVEPRGHLLAMHLHTRVIWCYACDAEVPDEYAPTGTQQQANQLTPQLVRSALDKEDAPTEVEDTPVDEPELEDADGWREFFNNPDGGRTGLSNLGNSCFFNAGIQALLHCPPLIAFFTSVPAHRVAERRELALQDCRTQSHMRNQELRVQLTQEFGTLLGKVWSGRYNLCVPTDFLRCLLQLNPFFRGYGQHDAQELIRCVIDNLYEGNKIRIEYEYDLRRKLAKQAQQQEEEEKKAQTKEKEEEEKQTSNMKRSGSSNSNSEDENAAPDADAAKKKAAAAAAAKPRFPDCSIIGDLFQGTLESRVRCTSCGAVSITRDPFYDLSLEIPKESQLKKIGAERGTDALTPQTSKGFFASFGNYLGITSPTLSLETCLHSFCTSDQLLQKDQYKCDRCKEKVDAVKILSLGDVSNLPEILTLHIKRFSHNSFFGSKIGRHVTFPLYNLDVTPYLNKPEDKSQSSSSSSSSSSHQNHSMQNGKKPSSQQQPKNNKKGQMNGVHPPSTSSSSSSSPAALYDLYAIIRHIGSVNGGHYIAYCKSHVTGKWYEFDDKIVTEMSEEKILKVEAYILFYRRAYSVKPLQKIFQQIEAVRIQNMPPLPSPSSSSTPSSSSQSVRYISRYWLKKMEIFGRPEPIDNRDLCCAHGMAKPLQYDGGDRAVAITQAGWDALFAEYGGGPIVDTHLGHPCEPCQLPVQRKIERARISEADSLAARQRDDDPFFLIDSKWIDAWRKFVQNNGPRPGPISNDDLLDTLGNPKPNLERIVHYRALHELVWNELHSLYGGGPIIERPTSDIYQLTKPVPVQNNVQDEQQEQAEDQQEEQGQNGQEEHQTEEPDDDDDDDDNDESMEPQPDAPHKQQEQQPQKYAYVNTNGHHQQQPQQPQQQPHRTSTSSNSQRSN